MISIIAPVYNGEQYIRSFIDSLANVKGDYDLCLIDNGSTDKTVDILKTLDIQWYSCLERSVYSARNYGAKMSKSEYLVFLDSDCYIKNLDVSLIKDSLKSSNTVLCGRKVIDNAEDSIMGLVSKAFLERRSEYKEFNINAGCFAIKKDVFSRAGKFPRGLTTGGDSILSQKLRENNYSLNLTDSLILIDDVKSFKERIRFIRRESLNQINPNYNDMKRDRRMISRFKNIVLNTLQYSKIIFNSSAKKTSKIAAIIALLVLIGFNYYLIVIRKLGFINNTPFR